MRTKKKATIGTRIADEYASGGDWGPQQRREIARRIDAAIRADGKKAFTRGRCFEQCKTPGKCDVCRKNAMLYGVKL